MKTLSSTTGRMVVLLAVPSSLAVAVVVAGLNSYGPRRTLAASAKTDAAEKPVVRFSEDGALLQPTGYRKWTYVGTPLTPNDMNGGKAAFPEFHTV